MGENKSNHGDEFKILTTKKMLQGLPRALAQAKAVDKSENLVSEIRQIT